MAATHRTVWLGLGALAAATALALTLAGVQAPLRAGALGLLAAIAAIAASFLLAVDRRRLLLLIVLLRASCDPLFDSLREGEGGGLGIGAALNALVILVAGLYALQRPRLVLRQVLPLWLPFLLAAAVAAAIAPEAGNGVRLFLVQVSYAAMFALPFYLVGSGEDVRKLLQVLLASSLVPVAVGLAELALGAGAGALGDDELRVRGTFNHPNIFAFYLVLMMALVLYLQKRRAAPLPAAVRWGLWCYTALLLVLLVATKTRSAWAGCLIIYGCYGLFFQRRFLLYALCLPPLLLLDAGVRERLLELGADNGLAGNTDLNSYAWRQVLWRAGLEWMQASHSLFGYGLDSFKYYSPRFFPLEGRDSWDPHNVYVQLYFEAGVSGLAAYGWLLLRLLGRIRRGVALDRPGAIIAVACVLAYLAIGYADNLLYYLSFNWYFWFFLGTVCAGHLALRRQAAALADVTGATAMTGVDP